MFWHQNMLHDSATSIVEGLLYAGQCGAWGSGRHLSNWIRWAPAQPRAALKSASDERPKRCNTALHFRMQCRKKHCTMQFKMDAAVSGHLSVKGASRWGCLRHSMYQALAGAAEVGLYCVNRESNQRADLVTIGHWLLIWSARWWLVSFPRW